jgi:hypothetical protein
MRRLRQDIRPGTADQAKSLFLGRKPRVLVVSVLLVASLALAPSGTVNAVVPVPGTAWSVAISNGSTPLVTPAGNVLTADRCPDRLKALSRTGSVAWALPMTTTSSCSPREDVPSLVELGWRPGVVQAASSS